MGCKDARADLLAEKAGRVHTGFAFVQLKEQRNEPASLYRQRQ
jgi:hypothetical protein